MPVSRTDDIVSGLAEGTIPKLSAAPPVAARLPTHFRIKLRAAVAASFGEVRDGSLAVIDQYFPNLHDQYVFSQGKTKE